MNIDSVKNQYFPDNDERMWNHHIPMGLRIQAEIFEAWKNVGRSRMTNWCKRCVRHDQLLDRSPGHTRHTAHLADWNTNVENEKKTEQKIQNVHHWPFSAIVQMCILQICKWPATRESDSWVTCCALSISFDPNPSWIQWLLYISSITWKAKFCLNNHQWIKIR